MAIEPQAASDITAQVLADNPELAERAKKIVAALLTDMERTIRIGDSAQKSVYTRALLPGILRAAQNKDTDANKDLQAAFERVMTAVRGG